MITVLRNYFKRGSQVVLWIIILTFVVGLMPLAFRQATGGSIWALRVNGQEVSYQEYLLEYERWKERIAMVRAQFGEYSDALLAQMGLESPQREAVQSVAKQELLNQFADSIGLRMSADFVTQKMSDPAYVVQTMGGLIPRQIVDPITGIDQAMLQRYLKHFNISIDMFERIIEKTLTEQLVLDIVQRSFYLPRFDELQHDKAERAKKKFSVLTIPLKPLLEAEKKREVTPEELTHFYDTNSQQYRVPEKRTGMLWEFDPSSYAITITDKQIEEYYENNKVKLFISSPASVQVRRILIAATKDTELPAAQKKAEQLKQEIDKDPSQFTAIAKRESDDKETAVQGGLMEPFTRGTREQVFDRAAFLLKEDGAVSEVIRTQNGYEIIQRVAKTPQSFKPLAAVKAEIKERLLGKEFRTQFSHDMKKVLDQGESLTVFIQQRGGKSQKLERIALDDSASSQHLFKLQVGHRTFFVEGTKGVVVQLDAVQEPFIPTLDTIKDTVMNDLREERAKEKLKIRLDEAKKGAHSGLTDAMKKEFGADVVRTGWLNPQDSKDVDFFQKKELPATRILQMEKIGSVISGMGADHGFIVRLDEIEPFNAQEYQVKIDGGERPFAKLRLEKYLQGFVDSLYRNATMETNESIITLET